LWPGGPPSTDGHGGLGFLGFPTAGVGVGVGRAVGRAVGVGVPVGLVVGAGVADGRGVGPPPWPRIGGVAAGPAGVGVGPSATIGPLAFGLTDGSIDGVTAGEPTGDDPVAPVDCVGPGSVVAVDPDELGAVGSIEADEIAPDGVGLPPATSGLRWGGARTPAVSATVARMRLRRPIATTRRAR
jgi:hypothetical protein